MEKMTFEKPEKQKEYGKNIHAILEFGRHEIPGKTPEGMSADFLTPEGHQRARTKGAKVTERKVAGYASPKLRAQATVDLALDNVNEDVRIINQNLENQTDKDLARASAIGQRPENIFKIKLRKELDTTKNFAKINEEAKTWAAEQIKSGSKRSAYDLIVQYYLDNPERCKELGVTMPHEAASEIAYRAAKELGMTERFYSGSDVRLINITHGPKLEPFLKEVLINQDGSKGFKSLEEIGGALNPGESFQLKVWLDAQGKKQVALLFRDKEYEVDEQAIQLLADEYRKKLKQEKTN